MARYVTPIAQAFDTSGNTIAGAKLYFYEEGTTTPQNTYTDDTLTTPNTNPVIADLGGFFPDIYLLNATYTVDYTDADDVTIWTADIDGTESPLLSTFISNAGLTGDEDDPIGLATTIYSLTGATFYIDNGAANSYVLVNQDDFTGPNSYIDGMMYRFRPANTNTGASTASVNGLPSKTLVNFDGTALVGGEIVSSEHTFIVFDEANDRLRIEIEPSSETTEATQAQQEAGTASDVFVTPAVQQFHESAAKARVTFDQTSTQSIIESYGLSSLTDTGVGLTTLNLSVTMGTTSATAIGSCGLSSTNPAARNMSLAVTANNSIYVRCNDMSGTAQDQEYCAVGLLGDLA